MEEASSTSSPGDSPPRIHVRWFQVEVPDLLSIAPIVLNPTVTWRPLTREESDACEIAWQKLPAKPASSATLSRSNSSDLTGDATETAPARTAAPLPSGMLFISLLYSE